MAANAFSDVLTQIPAGSSSSFNGILSQIPSNHSSGNVGGRAIVHSSSIKNMQQAIIDLGKTMGQYAAFNGFLHSRYDDKFDIGVMEAVGNAGKADGAWGSKTDAGLQSVLGLADALEKMRSSMGLKLEGFDPSGLKSIIPESYKSVSNTGAVADAVADKLAEEIGKLNGVYNNIAHFMQQRYGNKMSEDAEVIKYPGGLDKGESEFVQSNPNAVVLKLMDGTPVMLKDLASEQTLQAFFQRTYPGKEFDVKGQADWMLNQLQRIKQ